MTLTNTVLASPIEAEVRLHPDAQTFADEWSGITDPVLRRKLQNRLNQRAARKWCLLSPGLQKAKALYRTTQSRSSQSRKLK